MAMLSWFRVNFQSYDSIPSSELQDRCHKVASLSEKPIPSSRSVVTMMKMVVSCVIVSILLLLIGFVTAMHIHDPSDQCFPEPKLPDPFSDANNELHDALNYSLYPNIRSGSLRSNLLTSKDWDYSHPITSPYGRTPASARAADCRFSVMTFGRYPQECYDKQLETDFLLMENWTWHREDTLSEQSILNRDVVLGDFHRAFVSAKFYSEHCRFSNRKLLRALLGTDNLLVDNYVVRMGHLRYREKFTQEANQEEVFAVKVVK